MECSSTIYDPIRRKEVKRTPEEEVRQRVIGWLHKVKGMPLSLMASEHSFKFNGLTYRADIVVFDRSLSPLLLVECKAPSVKIDQVVVEQAVRYNRTLKVKFFIVTNGKTTYLCKWNQAAEQFEQIADLPSWEELNSSNL